jgi:high-affinity nickel permease
MTWDSLSVSNIFLACIALINIPILAILYERFAKKQSNK